MSRPWRWPWSTTAKASAVDEQRWVVLDVESSGLDPASDRLLAIGAVALRWDRSPSRPPRMWIDAADSFEALIGQPVDAAGPDRANILIHGIGVGRQQQGQPAAQVLLGFNAWAGASPRLGFHVGFDRAMLDAACRHTLGHAAAARWLDIEALAAVLRPDVKAQSLDQWLAYFGIVNAARHDALADAQASAELMLCLGPALQREKASTWAACERLAAHRRWLKA
jgi:DNA polymerase III subunit epsilon